MPDWTDPASVAPDPLVDLLRSGRANAIVAWFMVAVLAAVLVESILDLDISWMLFVGASGAVVLLPPVANRSWRSMLPWELLALALLPILVRGLLGGSVGTAATYLSVAALALLITVELQMFTTLEVTHWFAVAFVVLTTFASVAGWTMVRWAADLFLGTAYLGTNEELMTEWLWVAVAGLVAGVLFDAYFRRRDRALRRALWSVFHR